VKSALVTGAARGIGRAVAEALAKSGFRVVGVDKSYDTAPDFETITFDLTNLAGFPALLEKAGPLDVLVNNAGIQPALAIDRYTDEMRGRILRINLEAPVELIRLASKPMLARRSGRIINLASVAAYTPHTDIWYGITKAGIVSFTRSFANLLGPQGIQVNAVAPGPIDTALLANAQPERVEQLMRVVYTRRKGEPAEVAEAVRWLAVDAPQILNGAVIDVTDGCFLR
jgi:NAD(P)-dependent dehydrogenase (short-subunit alcohol dehydrogenase family)